MNIICQEETANNADKGFYFWNLGTRQSYNLHLFISSGRNNKKNWCTNFMTKLEINGPWSLKKWKEGKSRNYWRTDNCVKNHFYSNLRKAIRKLNKAISDNFRSEIKEIRPIVLYKIIEATDEHFKLSPKIR